MVIKKNFAHIYRYICPLRAVICYFRMDEMPAPTAPAVAQIPAFVLAANPSTPALWHRANTLPAAVAGVCQNMKNGSFNQTFLM